MVTQHTRCARVKENRPILKIPTAVVLDKCLTQVKLLIFTPHTRVYFWVTIWYKYPDPVSCSRQTAKNKIFPLHKNLCCGSDRDLGQVSGSGQGSGSARYVQDLRILLAKSPSSKLNVFSKLEAPSNLPYLNAYKRAFYLLFDKTLRFTVFYANKTILLFII